MKVRLHKVTVIRDEMTRVPKRVWHWELPILEAKFPAGYVIHEDEVEHDIEALPDAGEEYMRLTNAYGRESDSKRDYTEIVFGYGSNGVRELDKLLKESVCGAQASGKKKAAPKKNTTANQPADPLEE